MSASTDLTYGTRKLGARRLGWLFAATAGALTLVWLSYLGLTRDLGGERHASQAGYQIVALERGDLRETVLASGTMEPLSRVRVKSDVAGVVHEVHVSEGDRVEDGDPLVTLDQERLEDRIAELLPALERQTALARYDLIGEAELGLESARREFTRTSQLVTEGVASTTDLEQAQDELRRAEIGVSNAHAETEARRAAVEQARQTLRRARKDLEKSVITAPIAGVVISRDVEVGTAIADLMAGGTVVAEVANDSRIRLVAEVDENDVGRVAVGQRVEVRVDAFPDRELEGTVSKVSSSGTIDRNVSNFEVEIRIEGEEALRVGMSADARIVVRQHRDVVLVPNNAFTRVRGQPLLQVASANGRPDLVPGRTLYSDGFQTVIEETDRLTEGTRVLVRQNSDGGSTWER